MFGNPFSQYPAIVIIKVSGGDGTKNDDGSFTTASPVPDINQACRYEPSTLNRELPVSDGVTIKYKGIIYMPLTAPNIENGSIVSISGVLDKEKALFFNRGQLDCRLYV